MIGLLAAVAGVFGVDQYIKKKVDETFAEGEEKPILKEQVVITKNYNQGFAANIMKDDPKAVTKIHAAVAAVFLFCYTLIVREKGNPLRKVGCAFVLGGGLSNLYDRLKKGHVVDYIRLPFLKLKKLAGMVFNLSDVFILLGSIFILFGRSRKN